MNRYTPTQNVNVGGVERESLFMTVQMCIKKKNHALHAMLISIVVTVNRAS